MLIKYKSIDQFRQIITNVKHQTSLFNRENLLLPTLTFKGTVKIHGTNGGIGFNYVTDELWFQSRENIITIDNDNYGFCNNFITKDLSSIFNKCKEFLKDGYHKIVIYGEWCGCGIQKNVAISQLEKMFIIFNIKIVSDNTDTYDYYWLTDDQVSYCISGMEDIRIYHVDIFGIYNIDIDFNNPELSQNKIIDMVEKIEECCPVGKYFGIYGTGEGIVFKNYDMMFKVKGEKHSISKVKILAPVDIERVNSITELVNNIVSENRLEQFYNLLFQNNNPDITKLGEFIKLIMNDLYKEELDTIIGNGFTMKDISKNTSIKIKNYFLRKYNE